jgi:tetratricopeptide (TPR) repeat protein
VVSLDESLPGRIFISYRRQETAWPAGRLYDMLVEHFPPEQVFKDVDNIEPGEDFVERITAAVESCDVLLALIGPQWLTITNRKGQRRLDDAEDYVRLEIETALTRKIRVIPILVDEAQMPGADELPPTIAPLVRRNAVEINPLTFDTKRLISTVQKTLAALKISDIATGSVTPPSTARPDRSNQQVAGPEVEQLYDEALAAFWTEQWDKAVDLLGQILSRQPDYADAARKLELARRQQELALHYAEASAAADAGDWEQAVAGYTMVADSDPDYRDTNARLAEARHQQQLASLLAEAHRLHRAGQWAAVIKVGEQLQAIDSTAADPDGLMASARTELAAEQQTAQLAADYHTGLHLADAGQWEEAVEALERVTRLDSTYQDAPALLDRARRELEQARVSVEELREAWPGTDDGFAALYQLAAALAEEQARGGAEEEQARRAAEAVTRPWNEAGEREAEEQSPQQTEQRSHTPRMETPLKFYEPVEPGRSKESPPKQVQRPQQEPRKYGRWIILLTLAGLLVVVIIMITVAVNLDTNRTDRLLSHLPAAERSTCRAEEDPSGDRIAQVHCSTGSYSLWRTNNDARSDSESVLYRDAKEGDCFRTPPDEAGTYQYWVKNGKAGVLRCQYLSSDYGDSYIVEWSIDQLQITGDFSTEKPQPSANDYKKLLSEALRIRDGVT